MEIGIVGDCGATLGQLLDRAESTTSAREPSVWVHTMIQQREEWLSQLFEAEESNETPIAVERLLGDIREVLPDDGVLISGIGVRHALAQHIRFTQPMTHIVGSGYGTVSYTHLRAHETG